MRKITSKNKVRYWFIIYIVLFTMVRGYSQVPKITSFSPLFGSVGSEVVITGTNFNAVKTNNIVHFGAVKANIVNASVNSLTVNVPIGASNENIIVTTNGLTAWSKTPFLATFTYCGSPIVNANSWASPMAIKNSTVYGNPTYADFDNDGKIDFAVAYSKTVSVMRNIYSGGTFTTSSFANPIKYSLPASMDGKQVAGDLNGDGKKDILIPGNSTDYREFYILQNNSTSGAFTSGSFAAAVTCTVGQSHWLSDTKLTDLDGDGKADIIFCWDQGSISVCRNLGASGSTITKNTFSTEITMNSVGNSVSFFDIDGDSKLDLLSKSTAKELMIFKNNSIVGNLSFSLALTYNNVVNYDVGDLDNDGKLDLALSDGSTQLKVLRNISTVGVLNVSSFESPVDYSSTVSGPLKISDINGDGKLDLICGLGFCANATNGSGPFSSASFLPELDISSNLINPATNLMGLDLDADGLPDGTSNDGYFSKRLNYLPVTQRPEICMVTVDSMSVYNEIYWDKTLYNDVDSMIIYREVTSNIYKRIGAVDGSALSIYIDTARRIGPANGNPNIGTYRYKIQIKNSCGSLSETSLWHNTIFFINSGGTFFWNEYKIEGNVNPMTQFDLVRDNNAPTGFYTTVGSVAGTQTTLNDPFYAVYQNTADWRVFAYGLTCNPSEKTNRIKGQVVKSKSNIHHNYTIFTVIKDNVGKLSRIMIYPNPASSSVCIELPELNEELTIEIKNMLGELVYKSVSHYSKQTIDINHLANGIYNIRILGANAQFSDKLTIQK